MHLFSAKTMRITKNPFWALCGKIRPLVLNYPLTFVPGSVLCSSALCLFYIFSNVFLLLASDGYVMKSTGKLCGDWIWSVATRFQNLVATVATRTFIFSTPLLTCLSAYLSNCLPTYLSVSAYLLPVCLPTCLPDYLLAFLSIC